MRRHRVHFSFLVAVFGLFVTGCSSNPVNLTQPPLPQSPQTWALVAGGSSQQEAFQALNYYPTALTIDVGDTVKWTFPSGEPHTVTLLAPGGSLPPPNDPSVPIPAGGSTFDGTTYTSSGFVLLGGTYSLKFTKAGTYKFYCLIHSAMIGTITVNPAGTPYPTTQAAYNAQGSAAQAADLAADANALAAFPYPPNGNHLAVGISPGTPTGPPTTASVLRFLTAPNLASQTFTIPVGTTLTWTNLSNNEPHTVTFGIVGQPFPNIAPPGAPTGNTTYDGTAVSNSGIILPGQSYSLTFTAPGTYSLHCVYHDDTENMISTVIVQ
jgi:plastocyanin